MINQKEFYKAKEIIKNYIKNKKNKNKIRFLVDCFLREKINEVSFVILFFAILEIEEFKIKKIHIENKITIIIDSNYYFVNCRGELKLSQIYIYLSYDEINKEIECSYINVEENNQPINYIKSINYNFILNKIKKC